MTQVALVAHQHDDDVAVGVVLQLLQPALGVLIRQVLRDVVHQKSTDGAAVVSANPNITAVRLFIYTQLVIIVFLTNA